MAEKKRTAPSSDKPSTREIFVAFLLIGATSFGGGVVAHLRNSVVAKHHWMDDRTFLRLVSISQSLPGLNASNMAVLIGDRLGGIPAAMGALAGICLPGAFLMYVVGVVYQAERERPLVEAGLEGVAAAAVGLILATTLKLGRGSFIRVDDLVFIALTVVAITRFHMTVPTVLLCAGGLAAVWYGVAVQNVRLRR